MYCLPTPYSILNDPDDGEDVFKTIFPDTDAFCIEKRLAMWSRFHDTGIGNADQVYWMRAMKAKAAEIEGRYAIRFRVWQEYQARLAQAQSVDLSDGKIQSKRTARDDSSSSLRSKSTAKDDSTSSLKSKNTARHYDPPSGSSELSSYVSEGDTTDSEQSGQSGQQTETDFEQSGQSGQQTETDYEQNTYGGLEAETVRQYGDAVENPFEKWAAEFDKLFYWGL